LIGARSVRSASALGAFAANIAKLPEMLRNSGVMEQQNPRCTHTDDRNAAQTTSQPNPIVARSYLIDRQPAKN
jgi:hypothetical protein